VSGWRAGDTTWAAGRPQHGASRRWAVAVAAALLLTPAVGWPQDGVVARVEVRPQVLHLGERAIYRGYVVVSPATAVRWLPPDPNEALTWGERHARRTSRYAGSVDHSRIEDTVAVEIAVQAFQPGRVVLPGLRVQFGEGASPIVQRLPNTVLIVEPIMTPADSEATLRDVHGPLAAPWWERVPWILVIAAVLALVAVLLLIRMLRRRRPAPAVVGPARVVSPAEAALAALAELRARKLPDQDRIAEHAFHLGQILRRFLESTVGTPRPGDTTRELVVRLEQAGLGQDDVRRLAGLLRGWDRIKFAREPATRDEALRTESAVEAYVRRGGATAAAPAQREVA